MDFFLILSIIQTPHCRAEQLRFQATSMGSLYNLFELGLMASVQGCLTVRRCLTFKGI